MTRRQLIATVLNPWQWFCSTRTLSNCLETTVTIVALDLWPWQWSAGVIPDNSRAKAQKLLSRYSSMSIDRDKSAADAHRLQSSSMPVAGSLCVYSSSHKRPGLDDAGQFRLASDIMESAHDPGPRGLGLRVSHFIPGIVLLRVS